MSSYFGIFIGLIIKISSIKSATDHYDDHRRVQDVHPVPEEGDQAGHGANAARAQAEGDHGADLEVPLDLFLRDFGSLL